MNTDTLLRILLISWKVIWHWQTLVPIVLYLLVWSTRYSAVGLWLNDQAHKKRLQILGVGFTPAQVLGGMLWLLCLVLLPISYGKVVYFSPLAGMTLITLARLTAWLFKKAYLTVKHVSYMSDLKSRSRTRITRVSHMRYVEPLPKGIDMISGVVANLAIRFLKRGNKAR